MAYTFKHGDRPVEGYTIQRAVGKGGFGEVYYALSDGGREVAIKYLRDNPQVELRGVSNCINLKSPHLVAIFDVKKTVDDEYAIIMEYCSGPSLRDLLIAEPHGFEPQKAAFFVREIAKGLTYLHDRGIVHRDLKPGNIFYDDGYVKIGDYGLSKFIAVSRHSGQTASVGTVHYMAPEIGSGNYSKGVDIYALGVMLYEMLLGKVPFEGSSLAEVLMKHLTTRPEIDELPNPFGQVIRKALEKDPKDRYQSVDEMVADLLDVEEVRESLAGFRPQSLQNAVRRGTPERLDSPQPSPNPPPFAQPVGGFGPPPPPVGPVPDKLAKKMKRITRKMDARMKKLGHITGGMPAVCGPGRAAPRDLGSSASASPIPTTPENRKKRMLLSGLLSIGLAAGLGVLIGNTGDWSEEAGFSAAFLVLTMSGGVLAARSAVNWFGVQYGPSWTQHVIRLCCCAPLTAIGAAPLFDRHDEAGVAIWLGLLALSTFANWEKTFDRSASGDISFSSAVGHAFGALILTAIASAALDRDPPPSMMFAAGVAGAVSLIVQATSWWLPAKADRAMNRIATGGEPAAATPPAASPNLAAPASSSPEFHDGLGRAPHTAPTHATPSQPRVRWVATRAFWGLVAFGLMGGSIVTFLLSILDDRLRYGERTDTIVGSIGLASYMIFALRKTTPIKRDGFWRESVRPFLLSLSLFGIGAITTAIARHWFEVPSDERAMMISGLVMSSLLFVVLALFLRGQKRPPKPFLTGGMPSEIDRRPADVDGAAALAHAAGQAGDGEHN